jgi:septal ring factor EnvC (AmiA/AmiB activator)
LAQTGSAEARLRQQREELERIRRERDSLENVLRRAQGTVRNLSAEATNLARQADATLRAVSTLDQQLESITTDVDSANGALVRAQDEMVVKRATLQRRVVDIYKRGPMYTAEALLSAESFGELIARYKYLRLVALRDKALLARVEELSAQVSGQRKLLVRLQDELAYSRQQKAEEEQRLRALERQRGVAVVRTQRTASQAQARLQQIARDEARMNNVIANLEAERRRAEANPGSAAPLASSIKTSDFGKLDWPVDGDIIYRFGRVVSQNNTAIRWNGIGVSAESGAAVKAVAAGKVILAETMGTYGTCVIVDHSGGDYSVYCSLSRTSVRVGQSVAKGATVGAVGIADPELGPHLHFEIRTKGRAVDPLEWLRGQR